MDKTKIGRPKGANKKLVGIWLTNELNGELHRFIDERGMTLSAAAEIAIRNLLHPTGKQNAPKPLRAKGYDRFRENMRRNIKNSGGRLVFQEKEVDGELAAAGIIPRPDQRDAYLLKLSADELVDFRVEFGNYIFETMEWRLEQATTPETKLTPETATEPTPEDVEAHQRYLDLAAKAEADDDQKRRNEMNKKADEQEIRFRKRVMGLAN